MDVWLVTPAWRRPAVTRISLEQRRHLAHTLAAEGITVRSVIVADDDNLDVAAEYGCDTVEMPNDRLGAKFNAGIRYAGERGADYIACIGSDNWIHPDFFAPLVGVGKNGPPPPEPTSDRPWTVWREGPRVLSGRLSFCVDLTNGVGQRIRVNGAHGVIPWVMPRGLLEGCRFEPIQKHRLGQPRGMDGAILRGLPCRPGWVYHDPHDLTRVGWKSDVNLTPYPGLTFNLGYGPVEHDPWQLLADRYPAWLVDRARHASKELAHA